MDFKVEFRQNALEDGDVTSAIVKNVQWSGRARSQANGIQENAVCYSEFEL